LSLNSAARSATSSTSQPIFAGLYPIWYGEEHHVPKLLGEAAYGIPELFRDQLRGARLVAAAGCYVTASALALAPFVRTGAIEPTGVIVDAASGVSGAGRAPKPVLGADLRPLHPVQTGTVCSDFTELVPCIS
jgi:N-acetyl-gamma-glutamylphosphate reductase